MDPDDSAGLVRRALAGDRAALNRLVAVLTPVIQARVARTLLARRSRLAGGRTVRQEVEDLSQDVFLALFAREARVLRSWQPERGLSIQSFVGLVAERQVLSFLRSGKRNPWRRTRPSPRTTSTSGPRRAGRRRSSCLRRLAQKLLAKMSGNERPARKTWRDGHR